MPRIKTNRNRTAATITVETPDPVESVSSDAESEVTVDKLDTFDPDPRIRELIAATDSKKSRLMLVRLEPTHWEEQTIKGLLQYLPQEIDEPYFDYIKRRHGGGMYLINVIGSNNQFAGTVKFRIPGCPPRFPDAEAPSVPLPGGPAETSLPLEESHEGVRLGGTDAQFDARLERLVMLQGVLNPRPKDDINSVLLQYILQAKDRPSMIDQVGEIAGVLTALKELIPTQGSEAPTSLMGLFSEALKALPQLLAARREMPLPPGPEPGEITGEPSGQISGEPPVLQLENNQTVPDKGVTMPALTLREKAFAAAHIIAECFLNETKPVIVVQRFDIAFTLSREERRKLVPYREMLCSQAKSSLLALTEGDEDVPANIAINFDKYFNQVFDLFLKPDRDVAMLE